MVAVPTIANYLAPEGKQGQYQGVVNSASTVGKAFGPLIGGVLVDTFQYECDVHWHHVLINCWNYLPFNL